MRSRCSLARASAAVVALNSRMAIRADKMGLITQVERILTSAWESVWVWLNRFQPMMAPTMAWVVETGSPAVVIK